MIHLWAILQYMFLNVLNNHLRVGKKHQPMISHDPLRAMPEGHLVSVEELELELMELCRMKDCEEEKRSDTVLKLCEQS